eukprot:2594673-Pyramimonas_sp.AAC.1
MQCSAAQSNTMQSNAIRLQNITVHLKEAQSNPKQCRAMQCKVYSAIQHNTNKRRAAQSNEKQRKAMQAHA